MIHQLDYLRQLNMASLVFRLGIAMLSGGFLGMERERHRRPAGVRTYMMVCLGAALTTILSQYEFIMITTRWAELSSQIGIKTDVSRFGAQVINGIGFIGAGAIIVTRRRQVKGLTTAAGLWVAAIIGLAAGAGFYEGAIYTTLLILLAELLLSKLEYRIMNSAPEVNVYMEYTNRNCLESILQLLRELSVKVTNLEITRSSESGKHNSCAIFTLQLNKKCTVNALLERMTATEGVVSVEEL